ncbi:MAG: hypothetical protein QMD61_00555 [Methanobacterium sp.]|nr:hypothetical protein [Methanobacterium sp.]
MKNSSEIIENKNYEKYSNNNIGNRFFPNDGVILTITDVSRMKGDKVCIFGFDSELNHIRPIIPYKNVHERYLFDIEGNRVVKPFAKIEFDLIRPYPISPHTEDYLLNPCSKPVLKGSLNEKESRNFIESIIDPDISSIFGTKIIKNQYILKNHGNRSIGTIKAKKVNRIKFIKWKKQHRILFSDLSGEEYDLPITDCAFHKYFNTHLDRNLNPEKLNFHVEYLLNKSLLYLRIGLSRIIGEYKNHYLLVTGIYSYPDYKKQIIP